VIQIEALRIIGLRGIRELKIKPKRKSFVISGGNGSGKSGVVDAIEFALTGGISRLAGKRTVGLTVLRHGPHVVCDGERFLSYCNFANSALASFRIGMLGSASFQGVRKSL